MKKLISFSINNKLALWILTIFVILFGTYSGYSMKLETLPNINEPVVDVTTVYPGASPNEILEQVTEPIENTVSNLEGVKSVTSTSFENASSIQIQYDLKKNMEDAEGEVKEAVQSLGLPSDVEQPRVARVSYNDLPVLVLALTDANESLQELSHYAETTIKSEFESVEGISDIKVVGTIQKELEVSFNDKDLNAFNLTEQNVIDYIQSISSDAPLGLQVVDDEEQSAVIKGSVTSAKDLKNLEIPVVPSPGESGDGKTFVKMSEISTINEVTKEKSVSRMNGKEAIGIQVYKNAAGNTVQVVDGIQEKMKELEKKKDSLSFTSVLNEGDPIKDSVHVMFQKALMGAAFAILIILMFLRNIKTTIIAVVSIPLSLIISLMVLNQLDITLNLMTLGAMTVAIGRVVDDSIVVIENIFRRMTLKGETLKGFELIKEATAEMFSPIVSSTIVTIAVFLPLGLIDGPVGELFLPFGLTIVFALLASLIVSITIVPMMAHLLLRKNIQHNSKRSKERRKSPYKRLLNWSLNHKIISFVIVNVLLVGSLFLLPLIGVSFIPDSENKVIIASYNPVPGSTNDDIQKEIQKSEDVLLERDHLNDVQASFGEGNPLNPSDTKQVLFIINYHPELADITKEQDELASKLKDVNQGEWDIQSSGSGYNTLSLFVYGDNSGEVNEAVEKINGTLENENELTGLKASTSESLKQLGFVLDTEKIASLNIQPLQILDVLSQGSSSTQITSLNEGGEMIPVNVSQGQEEGSAFSLEDKRVQTLTNENVKLSELVKVEEETAPASITKRNGKVYGVITASITGDDVAAVTSKVEKEVDRLDLADGIEVEVGGVADQIDESFTQLGIAIISAIMIVYFVLVLTFGGGLAPLAILFSLPYAIIGSLVGLVVMNEPISISVMIGALMLIGIVVTNAIVLVDRIVQKEKQGYSTRESILEAGMTRLRPIFMTALATIGALAPLVITGESDGSGLISSGLGITVIGGLISSTVLTLFIVPVAYETLAKMKMKLGRKNRKGHEKGEVA
ncbi:efflux RND transporter permease subunit [Rossellomorea marisflavi]|uniref:Efflux RND transporter permease subunit n=1 Tax=Rossellomorea marisflavi TaxID=189381 RepID=A0A5D4RZ91_9BACI|nr:efflux RND transporter permease subunit [Rossellomorea marisflavi]TYS54902.1 efflux RND transporter permease subunit [Rossellomorea marisflavi]